MEMKPTDPSELFQLLREHAKALRADGVARIKIADLEVTFMPAEPELGAPPEDEHTSDPMNDPATYPGGRLPLFRRQPGQES